jgi:hypothetical protein
MPLSTEPTALPGPSQRHSRLTAHQNTKTVAASGSAASAPVTKVRSRWVEAVFMPGIIGRRAIVSGGRASAPLPGLVAWTYPKRIIRTHLH